MLIHHSPFTIHIGHGPTQRTGAVEKIEEKHTVVTKKPYDPSRLGLHIIGKTLQQLLRTLEIKQIDRLLNKFKICSR